jgi:putative endonuclease
MQSDLFRRHVYILASMSRVLYVGSTADLHRRVYQHKNGSIEGFTRRYQVTRLVYFESHRSILAALERERELKAWRRSKKIDLIETHNAGWLDLAADWFPDMREQGPSLRSG